MKILGAIHKRRPQNLTVCDPLLPPVSAFLAFYRQKLTVASAFGRPPPPLVRTSFMDDPLHRDENFIRHVFLIGHAFLARHVFLI